MKRKNIIAKDLEKAVFYYKRAAELGYPKSQLFLGDMYLQAKGVEYDAQKPFNEIIESMYKSGIIRREEKEERRLIEAIDYWDKRPIKAFCKQLHLKIFKKRTKET